MMFVLRMAGREIRASWKRLLFFFACVAVGVAAIVALRSVVQAVRAALEGQARTLLAADLVVQTNRPWDDATRQVIERQLAGAPVRGRTELIETATMARPADPAKRGVRMVELQGVSEGFPLHGAVTLDGGGIYTHALLRDFGALVRPEVLTQLDLKVGDAIVLGESRFTIRGVVLTEPGRRVGAFSFGARVLVDRADLLKTGLLSFGSRARHAIMLRVDDAALQPLVQGLQQQFRREFVTVRSYRSTEDQIGEDLQRAENYLSLVGFVILALGGVGVWSVTRVFIQQKVRNVAVLKCLGASGPQVLGVYVAQVLILGLAGSLMGVVIARLALAALPATLLRDFGDVRLGLTASAVLQGVGVGLLVSLLFALVPLLEVRRIKPLLLLRDPSTLGASPASLAPSGAALGTRVRQWLASLDWTALGVAGLVGLGLVAIAAWQAGSPRIGLLVSAGLVGVALALSLAATVLVRLVRPLRHARWFPLRHAVVGFSRPGNQTRVILLAVGLGTFFIIGVRALEANLLRALEVDLGAGGPDMFLIDIQPDQVADVTRYLEQRGVAPRVIPVVRARVTGVRGRDVSLDSVQDVRRQGSLAREYVVTWRDALEENERIVDGAFWSAGAPASPGRDVSIEESISERFGIRVGDTIRFDILGRIIEARVASVRRVEWGDTRAGGFMFVFRPGALEGAPATYIALLRGPADPTARAQLQRGIVDLHANVSAIDGREIVKTVEQVVGNLTLAVSIVGAVALVGGVLILVGSVAMTKFQRLHDAAVLKTLGASTKTIAAMLAVEYGVLGALAGSIGAAASLALTWVVSTRVLDIPWNPAPGTVIGGLLLTTLVVLVVGVAASVDVLRRRPLATLRAE